MKSDLASFELISNHFPPSLLQKAQIQRIPLVVTIELTAKCNLRCKHCFTLKKPILELSTIEIKDILNQLTRTGTFAVKFSGGEVFSRKDLFEIIRYAGRKEFRVGILTNATLISRKTARQLKKEKIMFVMISVYGADRQTHDSFTRTPGSFEKTIRGLNYLREEGIFVYINCPLGGINFSRYNKLKIWADSNGIPIIFNPRILRKRNGRAAGSIDLSNKQLTNFYKSPEGEKWIKTFRIDCRGSLSRNELLSRPLCDGGRMVSVITPYGDVLPCYFFPQSAGNIREKSFHEIWDQSPLFSFLSSLKVKDIRSCVKCKDLQHCVYCPAMSIYEKGDILSPSDFICKHAKILANLHNN